MKPIKAELKNKLGLYDKFIIRRSDENDGPGMKHEKCRYFVLDLTHDPFAVPAIRAYAKACRKKYPFLSDDLRSWLASVEIREVPR